MRRGVRALILLAVTVTACQPDQPRRPNRGEAGPSPGTSAGEAAPQDPRPVQYRIFNREDFAEPPRTMLHLLVETDANRGRLRATLARAINQAAESDSTLVALRAVGYVPVASDRGAREADLIPIAWAEWLPPSGWYDATPADRDAMHRLYYYQGTPPEWQK